MDIEYITRDIEEGKEEQKNTFVELRAKGHSYNTIAKQLHVTKATLTVWNKELSDKISELKAMELETLYDTFYLTKEARIKKIGGILQKLEQEAETRDLSEVPTGKLLETILKYREYLDNEYIETQETKTITKLNAEEILKEMVALYNKIKTGEVTKEQAYKENLVLMSLLKTYEATTLERKVDKLNSMLGVK